MPDDKTFVANDALVHMGLASEPPASTGPKVYTYRYAMTGDLAIIAESEHEAYLKQIRWSKERLAAREETTLEVDEPEVEALQ